MPQVRQEVGSDPEAGIGVRSLAVTYRSGFVLQPHRHSWGQLIFAVSGAMSVETDQASWLVPCLRGVWVPPGVKHSIRMSGSVAMRTVYVAGGLSRSVADRCCVVEVSSFLRELILRIVGIGILETGNPQHVHLTGVLLDELRAMPVVPLELPLPRDRRARRVAEALRDDPSLVGVETVVKGSGASRRTLERLFQSETGMTIGRWRQQLRLIHAVHLLASGSSVTSAALEVGYDSTSAFIAMFKQATGTTPGRYFSSPGDRRRVVESPPVGRAARAW